MAIDVVMPRLSDTMEEGTLVKWVKHLGETVAPGDVLAEVETDKATMELEAFDAGVLTEIRVGEGQAAPVGAVIAVLGSASEVRAAPSTPPAAAAAAKPPPVAPAAPKAAPAAPAPAVPAPVGSAPAPTPDRARPLARPAPEQVEGDRVRASPRARRLASERGIDLAAVRGSGPGGRVLEGDLAAGPATAPAAAAAGPEAPAGGRRVALGKIRRTTAARMTAAKRDVPHFYASSEIDVEALVLLKDELRARGGSWQRVTLTHLLLKAVGLALRDVPELNGSWADGAVVLHDAVNIGLAVSIDDGLIVPVVRRCDSEPLSALVQQAQALVERARAGRFAGDDLVGATFTVSNLGMYPISQFAAVVNPPHAGILAVGAVRAVPVVRGTQVVPGQTMALTLSCDHRVVDGVMAGRFLAALKPRLEQPRALLD